MISDASNSSKFITQTKKKIKPAGVSRSRMVSPGDFLLTNSMSFGRPYIMQTNGCIHDGWLVLSPKKGNVDHDYFYHLLGSGLVYSEFEKRAAGATVKNLNIELVSSVKVSLPPLDEQKRVAATLDQADNLRRLRQRAIDRLNELGQAIFYEMFGDPRRSEGSMLSEYADITMGQSPPGDSYNVKGEGIALLNGPTEFGERFPVEIQWTTSPTKLCDAGDLLFCVRGATAGRMNEANQPYCIGRGLAAITPRKSAYRGFLLSVLRANYDTFQAMGVGSTFINISSEQLRTFRVPKFDEAASGKFEKRLRQVDGLIEAARIQLEGQQRLFSSLQHRAFTNQL